MFNVWVDNGGCRVREVRLTWGGAVDNDRCRVRRGMFNVGGG